MLVIPSGHREARVGDDAPHRGRLVRAAVRIEVHRLVGRPVRVHRLLRAAGHLHAALDAVSFLIEPAQEPVLVIPCGHREACIGHGTRHRGRLVRSTVCIEVHRLVIGPMRIHGHLRIPGHFHAVLDAVSFGIEPTQELVVFPSWRPDTPIPPAESIFHYLLFFRVGSAVRIERHRLHFRRVGPVEARGLLVGVSGKIGVACRLVSLQITCRILCALNLDSRHVRGVEGPLSGLIRAILKQPGGAGAAAGSRGIFASLRIVEHALASTHATFELPDDGPVGGGNLPVRANGDIFDAEALGGGGREFALHGLGVTIPGSHDEVIGSHHEVASGFNQRIGRNRHESRGNGHRFGGHVEGIAGNIASVDLDGTEHVAGVGVVVDGHRGVCGNRTNGIGRNRAVLDGLVNRDGILHCRLGGRDGHRFFGTLVVVSRFGDDLIITHSRRS